MEHVDELHLDGDPVTEAFFSSPPPPVEIEAHDWDPELPLDRGHLRAMYATCVILVGSVLGLGGFLVHQKLIMPTPVELGATTPEIHWTVQDAPVAAAPAQLAAVVAPVPVPVPVTASVAVPVTASVTAPASVAVPVPAPRPARVAALRPTRSRASAAAVSGNSEVERSLKQAHAALRDGSARLARGHAINALALDPTSAAAYIVLGAARAALGDTSGAQQAYRLCAERATGSRAAACKSLVR